jgi:long-chain acyl-CoA synthetase
MVVGGDDKKFISALIVPSFPQIEDWAKHHGISFKTKQEIIKHPKINELLHKEIKKYNHDFGQWEQIKKFVLLTEEWSVESGELTPTMKPKRKKIAEKYNSFIESMYD